MIALLASLDAHAGEQLNLLGNPGFEQAGDNHQPANWKQLVVGVAPEFSLDTNDSHGGKHSIRIRSTEVTRAYVESDPIEVAPGEKISASAFVKVRDVPEKVGTVILIGHFSRADGSNERVEKFNVAKVPATPQPNPQWQKIEGSLLVPTGVDHLRIRAGFSYSKGTCWWDDLRVSATQPVVARLTLPDDRLSPAMNPLPITLINRAKDHASVQLELSLDKKTFTKQVKLTGEPIQVANIPANIDKRGKMKIELALTPAGQREPSFTSRQDALVPPALVLDPPIPTHWAVEDGPAKITGDAWTALKPELQQGGELTVRLLDASSKTVATWTASKIDAARNTFSLSAPVLPEGKYKIVADVKAGSAPAIHQEQPFGIISRRQAKTTINEDGFPVHDGKAIFPMGIFNSGKPDELATAGFTVTHAYNATRVFRGVRPNDQGAFDFLNDTEKVGMKACFMVPLAFAEEGNWDAFRRRIRMFKNHPALLCWDEEEGLARGDWKIETLAKVRQILAEEDPNHPFMVGDARDVIFRIKDRSNFFPLDHMDLGMWWWYPLPMSKKKTVDALEGEEVQGTELKPPTFLTQSRTTKPIWVGVQSYKKGSQEKLAEKQSRFPTPIEYRAQAYIAIAEGAKGLMWYGGYVTGGIFQGQNREQGHWNELKQLVTELNALSDIFMAPGLEKPLVTPENAPISVTIRKSHNRTVLIAVNRSEDALDTKISSKAIKAGTATVIGEGRFQSTEVGCFSDRFEAYAAHVYELP
ncbi:MAG TPA: hypothetical protein VF669_06185 [Tepidisphaeraceae bacterium]|jgi:hypothetical protein